MLCENCGKKEANVRYTENINGKVRELNLCEECSHKLGIGEMDFSMPIDFSSFLGGFMDDLITPEIMPMLGNLKEITCDNCGTSFNDIINTGKVGCGNCYSVFEDRLEPIIKRIQGGNKHVGRIGKIIDNKIDKKEGRVEEKAERRVNKNTDNNNENKLESLQEKLKQAIKEERYEDAAKIRDEIKKLEK